MAQQTSHTVGTLLQELEDIKHLPIHEYIYDVKVKFFPKIAVEYFKNPYNQWFQDLTNVHAVCLILPDSFSGKATRKRCYHLRLFPIRRPPIIFGFELHQRLQQFDHDLQVMIVKDRKAYPLSAVRSCPLYDSFWVPIIQRNKIIGQSSRPTTWVIDLNYHESYEFLENQMNIEELEDPCDFSTVDEVYSKEHAVDWRY